LVVVAVQLIVQQVVVDRVVVAQHIHLVRLLRVRQDKVLLVELGHQADHLVAAAAAQVRSVLLLLLEQRVMVALAYQIHLQVQRFSTAAAVAAVLVQAQQDQVAQVAAVQADCLTLTDQRVLLIQAVEVGALHQAQAPEMVVQAAQVWFLFIYRQANTQAQPQAHQQSQLTVVTR
jgi:hypothetical protein